MVQGSRLKAEKLRSGKEIKMVSGKKEPGSAPEAGDIDRICFGLGRASDELSLKLFLESLIKNNLLQTMIPRLDDAEIISIVDFFTGLMNKHLSKKEYHELFLSTPDA